jgi:S-DNA-T family DNA segregation ATPase FtsK/SpoIIIE
VQGVFISDHEIEGLVKFWQTAKWASLPPIHLRASSATDGGDAHDNGGEPSGSDSLLQNALVLAQSYNKLSTSLLQRRLRIGYPRAARLMDELEEQGVIGPSDGSKSRDVIIR